MAPNMFHGIEAAKAYTRPRVSAACSADLCLEVEVIFSEHCKCAPLKIKGVLL